MTGKAQPKFIFDFQKLIKTFTEICPDFTSEPHYENATMSRRFAEQVIFDYSKQAKLAKSQSTDKTWRLMLDAKSKNTVVIKMYVTKPPPQCQPTLLNGYLQITFKQASLLAVAKYCQLVPHLVERHQIVLTPLAGAVFAPDDMPKLATALGESLPELLMAVISSCQTDGYYLKHSRCCIAVAAVIKTVANLDMRASIVKKTIKMYQLHGKNFNMAKFRIYNNFIQSSSGASNRSSTSRNNEVDDLVSQIMSLNVTKPLEPPSRATIKRPMKCAANFHGRLHPEE